MPERSISLASHTARSKGRQQAAVNSNKPNNSGLSQLFQQQQKQLLPLPGVKLRQLWSPKLCMHDSANGMILKGTAAAAAAAGHECPAAAACTAPYKHTQLYHGEVTAGKAHTALHGPACFIISSASVCCSHALSPTV
jgi:hypothetical protein